MGGLSEGSKSPSEAVLTTAWTGAWVWMIGSPQEFSSPCLLNLALKRAFTKFVWWHFTVPRNVPWKFLHLCADFPWLSLPYVVAHSASDFYDDRQGTRLWGWHHHSIIYLKRGLFPLRQTPLLNSLNFSTKFPKFLLNLGVCILRDLLIVLDSTNRALPVCNLWTIIIFSLLC